MPQSLKTMFGGGPPPERPANLGTLKQRPKMGAVPLSGIPRECGKLLALATARRAMSSQTEMKRGVKPLNDLLIEIIKVEDELRKGEKTLGDKKAQYKKWQSEAGDKKGAPLATFYASISQQLSVVLAEGEQDGELQAASNDDDDTRHHHA